MEGLLLLAACSDDGDNVQKDNLNDINSNEIESIEILKDAAVTALYGDRANNGVVLVTSKNGYVGKLTESLDVNVGKNIYRAPYDFLNVADYLYWERMAFNCAGKSFDEFDWEDINMHDSWTQDYNISFAG